MAVREIEALAAQHARERDASLLHEKARRREHGIVHTPPELAQSLVRISDRLLRERLGLPAGACDERVLWVDPACGPGAFFAAALGFAEERGGHSIHGLGFDIDADALTLATRLCAHPAARLRFEQADVLADERVAQAVATHAGPLLIVGNPPWVSARAQLTAADRARLEPFRHDEAGERLQERKLGVLADAYVRFFALCAQVGRACEAGAVVALVSNGSYLDGLMHRGMRARLLTWFDEVHVLDLGGSALLGRRREQRDDNVFGVRPSVAVTWLCRYPGDRAQRTKPDARSFYARSWGTRQDKLAQLTAAVEPTFVELAPQQPTLLFVPRAQRAAAYERYPSLPDWLSFHREGVQSNRDAVVVADSAARLLTRLRAFAQGLKQPELEQAYRVLPHYDPLRARRAVAAALERDPDGTLGITVRALAYRPLDTRVFCPIIPLCHRPRPELARALDFAANALISVRKDRGDLAWTHSAWANTTVDNCYLSARSSCRARAFPSHTPEGQDNLSPRFADILATVIGEPARAQTFLHYALAVLSAASYRARWEAELRHDYPRIPVPPSAAAYRELAQHGERLASLHALPCEGIASVDVNESARDALHRDLSLAADESSLCLHGQPLLTLSAQVHAMRIGHHRPIASYIASRSMQPLDQAALRRVFAVAERAVALEAALSAADSAVASYTL